jgi:hypothetical protein
MSTAHMIFVSKLSRLAQDVINDIYCTTTLPDHRKRVSCREAQVYTMRGQRQRQDDIGICLQSSSGKAD